MHFSQTDVTWDDNFKLLDFLGLEQLTSYEVSMRLFSLCFPLNKKDFTLTIMTVSVGTLSVMLLVT